MKVTIETTPGSLKAQSIVVEAEGLTECQKLLDRLEDKPEEPKGESKFIDLRQLQEALAACAVRVDTGKQYSMLKDMSDLVTALSRNKKVLAIKAVRNLADIKRLGDAKELTERLFPQFDY